MSAADRVALVIFDCDGTLVDSQHVIVACMADAFATFGLAAPAPHAVARVVGLSLAAAIAALLPQGAAADAERMADVYRDAFRRHRAELATPEPLYPGALAALDALEAAGALLAIATGKSRSGVEAVLGGHGLLQRFVSIQTPDNAVGKPAPDMALQAMAAVGATPDATAVVGDTVYDMQMAGAAGVRGVGVAWGYHDAAELRAAGAVAVVERFEALYPTLAPWLRL